MHGLMGGYGVSAQDPNTFESKYTNLNAASIWIDCEHKHNNFTPGVFIGLAKT